MKREYVRPVMVGERFFANEYVAACWGVGCDTSAANKLEREMGNDPFGGHRSSMCGDSTHQYIIADAEGTAVGMKEVNHDQFADMQCTIYTDKNYTTKADVASIEPGDTIYWMTKGGNWTYHHVGTVHETYPGKPNRS